MEKKRFAPEIETAAYRLVQEALTNVARHAKVGEASVRLWSNERTLSIEVEDYGVGFVPDSVLASETSGLAGMRERAALLGGELKIESFVGKGTRLVAKLKSV